MRNLIALLFLAGCTAGAEKTQDPLTPTPNPMGKPAGAACTKGSDCKGGTCLGAPGQPEEGNNRFTGGYCTTIRCTPDSQEGCGADEWCVEGGELGGYCVEMCSKADGLVCDRADHVCLGLGSFGGCFSHDTVECNPRTRTGCGASDLCIKIGFEDHELGRCETACDPMDDQQCTTGHACYYIKSYSAAFCSTPGTLAKDEICSCDKCCEPGLACTPDGDGAGRHCKELCALDEGCGGGERCVPLKTNDSGMAISPYGGCVAPGSEGS